ncbi:hypothetical protein GCM10009617_01130 [Leifsonia poae]|uniref:Uncharacterized protein n=1 Tax=Leifsonia poae TaxID=110933 RepID=A0A9W6H5W8_9MICO|nr:hypothetical protein GCM10017584_01140 [Leifsonia poae]
MALLLIVGGAIAMIVGGLVESVAKAPADRVTLFNSAIPTLPVGVYRQYTQAAGGGIELAVAPDYAGLWIGATVALLGVIALLAGVVVASAKRHTA